MEFQISFLSFEETNVLKNATEKIKKDIPEWTFHGSKHKPKTGVPWKKIMKSTESGVAKYKPEINIKEIELHAWHNGTPVTTPGKNFKVFKSDSILGAKRGKETYYMRVECSANTIHGHPISEVEFLKYLRKQ